MWVSAPVRRWLLLARTAGKRAPVGAPTTSDSQELLYKPPATLPFSWADARPCILYPVPDFAFGTQPSSPVVAGHVLRAAFPSLSHTSPTPTLCPAQMNCLRLNPVSGSAAGGIQTTTQVDIKLNGKCYFRYWSLHFLSSFREWTDEVSISQEVPGWIGCYHLAAFLVNSSAQLRQPSEESWFVINTAKVAFESPNCWGEIKSKEKCAEIKDKKGNV